MPTTSLALAADRTNQTVADLRAALAEADPVAALLLLPMIAEAAALAQSMEALLGAMHEAARSKA